MNTIPVDITDEELDRLIAEDEDEFEAQAWEDACNEMKMREAMWADNGYRWISYDSFDDDYNY